MILEPREGGRWYERGVDGTECDWGRVLAWEPPHRLVFTWQINGAWQFDPDPEHASEIEVAVHRGRARARPPSRSSTATSTGSIGGQAIHDAIRGGGGWALLLDGFAKTVADQS